MICYNHLSLWTLLKHWSELMREFHMHKPNKENKCASKCSMIQNIRKDSVLLLSQNCAGCKGDYSFNSNKFYINSIHFHEGWQF